MCVRACIVDVCCASNTSLCVCHVPYIVGMSCVPMHACMVCKSHRNAYSLNERPNIYKGGGDDAK